MLQLGDARRSAVVYAVRLAARAFLYVYASVLALLVAPLKPDEVIHALTGHTDGDVAVNGAAAPAPEVDARPAVSFGGCGMLYPYQLGVGEYIADTFDTRHVRTAGHSAGFAAALCVAIGVPTDLHWRVLCAAQARWTTRLMGFVGDSEEAWMAPYVAALAENEAAICSASSHGRLVLGHTRVRARTRGKWPPLRAGHAVTCRFHSLPAFVHAVTVSQRCPPFYRAPGWIHGAWGLDGAFSAQFTEPPGTPSDGCRLVTVSPTNPLADIAPAMPFPPHWFATLPDKERWDSLRAQGYADAAAKHDLFLARGFVLRGAHSDGAVPAECGTTM
jgi:hypothetical protein